MCRTPVNNPPPGARRACSAPAGNHRPLPCTAAPRRDQIAVATLPGRYLCHSLAHQRRGPLAEGLVTFGQPGTRCQPGARWRGCRNRTCPLSATCWDTTGQAAQGHRPSLVIHGYRGPVPPVTCPAGAS
jgi:hypothetical protein